MSPLPCSTFSKGYICHLLTYHVIYFLYLLFICFSPLECKLHEDEYFCLFHLLMYPKYLAYSRHSIPSCKVKYLLKETMKSSHGVILVEWPSLVSLLSSEPHLKNPHQFYELSNIIPVPSLFFPLKLTRISCSHLKVRFVTVMRKNPWTCKQLRVIFAPWGYFAISRVILL